MPIRFTKNVAYLEDDCGTDDAEPLLEWFREHPKGKVNLKTCWELHTAVLQVLMAVGPSVTVQPVDEALARWLPPPFGHG
jgi:hypothetical protein